MTSLVSMQMYRVNRHLIFIFLKKNLSLKVVICFDFMSFDMIY